MIGKIAFLFLTIDSIFHEAPWVKFFHHPAASENYSLYIHSKKSFSPNSFFAPFVLSQSIPTTWSNTMNAQVELLREALKDPDNIKFVFLSESTIPLANFEDAYNKLVEHQNSQFWYRENPFAARSFGNILAKKIYHNAQWVVLNRIDAELMVTDTELLPVMIEHRHDQEHYPSTFLAYHKRLETVVKKDLTFVYWPDGGSSHPYNFTDLKNNKATELLTDNIKKKRFLFGRKFSQECDLSPLHDLLPELY